MIVDSIMKTFYNWQLVFTVPFVLSKHLLQHIIRYEEFFIIVHAILPPIFLFVIKLNYEMSKIYVIDGNDKLSSLIEEII